MPAKPRQTEGCFALVVRVFRQYIPVPFLVLGVVEFVLFAASVYLGVLVYAHFFAAGAIDIGAEALWTKALAFALVMRSEERRVG